MAGRPAAIYAERTTDNVVLCLTNHFRSDLAFEYETALRWIISAFACQRTTARDLLDDAIADEELYVLHLVDGGLYKADLGGKTVHEFDDFPTLTTSVRRFGLQIATSEEERNRRTRSETTLALVQVFDPWVEKHAEAAKARKAEELAERDAERATARAMFPSLAPVVELGARWKEIADAKEKSPPVGVSLFEVRGKPVMTLDLRGAALERMGPELLALLQKHYPLPDGPEGSG